MMAVQGLIQYASAPALAAALAAAAMLTAAPVQAEEASRWLDSNGQASVSAVRAQRWVKPEIKGKLVERGQGVYVQIQDADEQKDGHCVMDVPPVRENRFTGTKEYRVRKAVNICE